MNDIELCEYVINLTQRSGMEWFDSSFILDVYDKCKKHNGLTPNQRKAVVNIKEMLERKIENGKD